ncbi:MAG: enoyl-CoA hydratase-related protein [Deltaproteobacteria bacterium]
MSELLIQNERPHVELWTLCAEARHNSLSRGLVAELIAAVERLGTAREVRAVVVTGQGSRTFCAGADLKERATMSAAEVHGFLGNLRKLTRGIERSGKAFVAALNGSAYGGGVELALACDLRVAAEDATLQLTEVTLGIIPGGGGTQRLPRLVGPGRARDIILTGRPVPSAEALAIGLVDRLCPEGKATEAGLALAEQLAANGPIAVAAAKAAILGGLDLSLEEGLDLERREYEKTLGTKDRLEGLVAFHEKRKPVYRGE